MGRDEVFPEIPFVLHHLRAEGAGDALRLDMYVDDVLLQVERVGEGLPAVVAQTRLHTAPPVARMLRLLVVVLVGYTLRVLLLQQLLLLLLMSIGKREALSFRE